MEHVLIGGMLQMLQLPIASPYSLDPKNEYPLSEKIVLKQ
jgi:hypothetical protein